MVWAPGEPSEPPAPSQEMPERKIHQVRKPDLTKSPSIPNSGGVAGREGAGAEAQEQHSGKHSGGSFACSSSVSSGLPAVSQPPPQIDEANKLWAQSEHEPRSEQGMARKAFWRQRT